MNAEEIQAEIARRNALFEGKTRNQKRVLLAQDVLDQIAVGRMTSYPGYVGNDAVYGWDNDDKSLQELFLESKSPCRCCAIGALMVSCTLFNNQETRQDWMNHFVALGSYLVEDRGSLKNGLLDIFSREELLGIERQFENGGSVFYHKYINRQDRMVAIMESIIANNGNLTWDDINEDQA